MLTQLQGSGYQVTVTVHFNPACVFQKKKEYFATASKLPQHYIFKGVITTKPKEVALIKLSASRKIQKIPCRDMN